MNKTQKLIIWQILREKDCRTNLSLLIHRATLQQEDKYFVDRGFTRDQASEAMMVLFDSVKPTE